jgi:DNA-binding Lrp family transcriptional regulator
MSENKRRALKDMDIHILEALTANPCAENKDLCNELKIPPRTLEDRLKILRAAELITGQQRVADLVATGSRLRYRVDIKINPNMLHKSTIPELVENEHTNNRQELLAYYIRDVIAKKCAGVIIEDVSILLGDPADLSATIVVPSHTVIFDFITRYLRALDVIENTSTSHVAWRLSRAG